VFPVDVPWKQKHDEADEQRRSWNQISDVESDLLLNVDHQSVGDATADVGEPVEPVEKRVNSLLAKPLHLT